MKKITVRWEVEDGYVGNSRPQQTVIDIEQNMSADEWAALSEDEKKEFIEQSVQDDFEQKISFGITDYGI